MTQFPRAPNDLRLKSSSKIKGLTRLGGKNKTKTHWDGEVDEKPATTAAPSVVSTWTDTFGGARLRENTVK